MGQYHITKWPMLYRLFLLLFLQSRLYYDDIMNGDDKLTQSAASYDDNIKHDLTI